MHSKAHPESAPASRAAIAAVRSRQHTALIAEGQAPAAVRRARLQAVIDLLVEHADALCAAMDEDFGGRPAVFSLMNDVLGSLGSLKHARDHVEAWMAPDIRPGLVPFDQFGASASVRHDAKGVVGIMGTWNAPLYTLFSPLACVLAAGNRAVLKPSEVTPRTAALVARLVAERCDAAQLAVVTGGPDVARDFAAQPWDHLVFTGSSAVGKLVMRAAADNLVPLTLELGGKSPVIVGRGADIANAAERIAVGKSGNSGQLCVAPDTVWVHAGQRDALVAALQAAYAGLYPAIGGNPDVVAAVNAQHHARVEGYLADAARRGATIVTAGAAGEGEGGRRMPLRLVLDAPPGSQIASEEIFGSALLINTYTEVAEAVAAINAGPCPLALYYFGQDQDEQAWVLDHTRSGGVTLNDVTMHPALHAAPFGGVGASGMGHYHGREGFLAFSHARTVYQAGGHDPRREWGMLPPYSDGFKQMIRAAVTP
jgi:coniferyl-aldehyde dehydrogenase